MSFKKQTIEWAGGRAGPRDADTLGSVKMGWASLDCSVSDCSF